MRFLANLDINNFTGRTGPASFEPVIGDIVQGTARKILDQLASGSDSQTGRNDPPLTKTER